MNHGAVAVTWTVGWGQVWIAGVVHAVLALGALGLSGMLGALALGAVLVSAIDALMHVGRRVGSTVPLSIRQTVAGFVCSDACGDAGEMGRHYWLFPGLIVLPVRVGHWRTRWLWVLASELAPGDAARLRRYLASARDSA